MTQEQKAKAYDEALKRAKFYHGNCPSEPERRKLEKMFPMLRESKDDRIRKSLIKFLTDIKEISESGRTTWAVRKEDAEMCKSFIAYIEKQKETSHISEMCKENANSFTEDERIRQWLYDLVDEGAYLCERPFATESILAYLEKQNEQKHNYCLYGGYPNVGRCRWCSAACSARLTDVHTDEEKEYVRTIKSIISDFIRDKKPENLAYYQRIYDWLDGRHVPFSCGHENGKPADPDELDFQQEQLPGIEEHGIPGKDFIPVEWVDACEKYGKWKIVQQEQPEIDLEKEYKEYVEDDPVFSKLTNRNVGFAIARHFYELGLNARKEEEK